MRTTKSKARTVRTCDACGHAEWLIRSTCEVTGEDVWTCVNLERCLERFHREWPARRVAMALAGLRGGRT